jgi:DNA-binding transcriptional LysR family regulator
MKWDDVRIFVALARTGRLAAAARTLGVEHTTISRRVAALEEALGSPVFYRTAGGYLLTPVGESVLAEGQAMERHAELLAAKTRERAEGIGGRVRLALNPEFASHWLAVHLPAFRARYPAIALQVLVGTRPLDLSRGEAEIAVRTPHPRQPRLIAVRIARTTLGLYAAKGLLGRKRLWIDSVATANSLPLLVYTPQLNLLQKAVWFRPLLRAGTIALETNSTHALLAAARAGAGVAVLPRFVARTHDDLVPVSEDVAGHDVWLITHPEYRREARVRETADFLKRIAVGAAGLDG